MNMRGIRADPIDPNTVKINVTSSQAKDNCNRRDFSPMTPIEGGYKQFWNFESYWQSGKVFEGIDRDVTVEYWRSLREPKRRYPGSKNKRVLYATWDGVEQLDYISSRKQVYVPEYYELIRNKEIINEYRRLNRSITIYDFDGPRTIDGAPCCLEVTRDLLIEKINDETYPFGHGYVVAATIAGIIPEEYCI